MIRASAAAVRDDVGLLGPVAPGGMGVPALRDGTRLPPRQMRMRNSLRSTARSRIRGASRTRRRSSTTRPARPPPATWTGRFRRSTVGLDRPDDRRRAEHGRHVPCATVTDPELSADCIYDVGATGDTGFATSYAATQSLYDAGIAAPPPAATPIPAPTAAAVVAGALKSADVFAFGAATLSPTHVLYVSLQPTQTTAQILAIDARTAAILNQVDVPTAVSSLHYAAGSVWAADLEDGPGTGCLVTRFDGTTLAKLATIKVVCDPFGTAQIVSNSDELWWIDTSTVDGNGRPPTLRRINPATNAIDSGVALPFNGGRVIDSQGALFLGDSAPGRGMYRLTEGASAFEAMGPYSGVVYAAGTGFWQQGPDGKSAVLTTGPGGASQSVPLTGGFLVAGDAQGAYVQQPASDGEELWRFPSDGSSPTRVALAPTVDGQPLEYAGNSLPSFTTPRRLPPPLDSARHRDTLAVPAVGAAPVAGGHGYAGTASRIAPRTTSPAAISRRVASRLPRASPIRSTAQADPSTIADSRSGATTDNGAIENATRISTYVATARIPATVDRDQSSVGRAVSRRPATAMTAAMPSAVTAKRIVAYSHGSTSRAPTRSIVE